MVIVKNEDKKLINEVKSYFKIYNCENNARNLELIKITDVNYEGFIISNRFKNKFGIWLIGYDGEIKAYSNNSSILKKLHSIIDLMPIRQSEMALEKTECNEN